MKENEKQAIEEIDELTTVLYEANHKKSVLDYRWLATEAYNTGYRKQSKGEWISNELGGYKYAFYCSECGWVDGYPFNDRHKYCPNCGAKMKGGAE